MGVRVPDILDFETRALDGTPVPLGRWRGQVLLIVNTASQCGFTPQYAGLQALHARFAARGFAVLGFPCNQFGAQEPGEAAAIASFCETRFAVGFPMFAKVEVNGPGAHPFWQALKAARPGLLGSRAIKWNFTKFLIDRTGRVIERFAPAAKPEAIEPRIAALL